jgi:membrane protease YdiL (CAAX protease family)
MNVDLNSRVEEHRKGWTYRLGLFTLFLFFGISIISIVKYSSYGIVGTPLRIAVPAALLAAIVLSRRNARYEKYWLVLFAFFAFSDATYVREVFDSQYFISQLFTTVNGLLLVQIGDTFTVVIPIILLTKVSGADMGSIFLKKGNVQLALTVGIPVFLVFFFTSVLAGPLVGNLYGAKGVTFARLFSLTPWMLALVLLNGFGEEVWFRCLFLKKYQPLLGRTMSNVLQAPIFAFVHVGSEYAPILFPFLVVTFFLGLGLGYLMQKTDGILGSWLCHAGADVPIYLILISVVT